MPQDLIPKPDPLFYLAGGPGQANVDVYRGYVESWIRHDRDIVFVNVRGTGGDNDLQCELHCPTAFMLWFPARMVSSEAAPMTS